MTTQTDCFGQSDQIQRRVKPPLNFSEIYHIKSDINNVYDTQLQTPTGAFFCDNIYIEIYTKKAYYKKCTKIIKEV